MPAWKALFIMFFGILCLALVFGTIIVTLALTPEEHKWEWFSGLLGASIVMGTLFALFLRSADRAFVRQNFKRDR